MLMRLASHLKRRRDRITLGVQGVVADETGAILLVRHGYRPGWHFPGGGVERGETVEAALARELDEETGVAITGEPRLFGLYTNFAAFPGDHVALFLVDQWRRIRIPKPNAEIAEQRFFARSALPPDITPGAARRLNEIFGTAQMTSAW